MRNRLGLRPPQPDSVKLKLADYLHRGPELPPVPADFGHASLISRWGMLGNGPDGSPDVPVGDCAIAGPEHIIMAWNAAAGRPVPPFTYGSTIAAYSAVTGYDPSQYDSVTGENPTDQGSDMTEVARYWQQTGFTDSAGTVHKIAAFLGLDHTNIDQIAEAAYLYEAVGFGFDLPESAEEQFQAGQPWTITGAEIAGGHFVPVVGRVGGNFQGITWGGVAQITPDFIRAYASMAIVYLSPEMLSGQGKSAEGLDIAALTADLPSLEAI